MVAFVAAILNAQFETLEAMQLADLMMWHAEAITVAKLLHGNGKEED